jgi:adenylate kinase
MTTDRASGSDITQQPPPANAFGADSANNQVIRDLFMSFARHDNHQDEPCLQVEDVRRLLESIGEHPSEERLRTIIDAVDLDRSGTVELDEFLAGCEKVLGPSMNQELSDVDKLIQTFRTLDTKGNGHITIDELDGLLSTTGGNLSFDDAQHLLQLADTDGSGGIDLSEFIAFVTDPKVATHSWRLRSGFRAILVIGGPGSGKGLICNNLVEKAGIQHCSSGDLLRDEVAAGSPLGEMISQSMMEGKLLPSSTIVALMKKRVAKFPGAFVALDGFPRSKENCIDFERICGAPELCIYIDVPDEVMMERMLERGRSSGRVDDNAETAAKRIETFHTFGEPTLQYLDDARIPIHRLDGEASPEEVWNQLLALDTPLTRRVL